VVVYPEIVTMRRSEVVGLRAAHLVEDARGLLLEEHGVPSGGRRKTTKMKVIALVSGHQRRPGWKRRVTKS